MARKLIEILVLEIPLYKDLLSLLQEEKRLLSTRTRDELYQLSSKIKALAFKIKEIERIRDGAVIELAASHGIDTSNVLELNLTKLLKHIKEPERGELIAQQALLLALVGSIEELNKENSIIIGRSIEHIKTAFDFIREFSSMQLYKSNGAVDNQTVGR